MAASNGAPASYELDVQPPPDITIPPPNVRETVAKTADFIIRRGEHQLPSMKLRVAEDAKSKLTFVLDGNVYNPYFAWFLQQLKDGHGPAAPSAKSVPEKPQGPPEPPNFLFSARMPNINSKDLEVIKLTALYTARAGENWLKELRNREAGNSQFDFLRATHSFFPFFRSMVAQYEHLEDEKARDVRKVTLRNNVKNVHAVLDRARERAEYTGHVMAQKQKDEKKAEDEKKEYASIDWHDFTIIATVLFDEADDNADLPPPALLNDLQSQSLEQKAAVSLSTRRLEEAMPDEATYYNATQQPAPQNAVPQPPTYPTMPPMSQPYPSYAQPQPDYNIAAQRAREEEQARIKAENDARARTQTATRGAPGRIVTDYVPRTAAKKASVAMDICPNCKQSFPSNEMAEHIRIELLDPRWKEQRDKSDARYSTTINTADVANNLKRFASQRNDIYDGVTGMALTPEEELRRKKAATAYAGQPDAPKDATRIQQMQSMNVQEQLRSIREKHGH